MLQMVGCQRLELPRELQSCICHVMSSICHVADGGVPAVEPPGEAEAVQRTPSTLSIQYVVCEASQKLPQLVAFLQASHAGRAGGWL